MNEHEFLRYFATCTVAVLESSKVVGTGFFAAPGMVVTCAHVVAGRSSEVSVRWKQKTVKAPIEKIGNPKSLLEFREGDSRDPDLALLNFTDGAFGTDAPPCVLLEEEVPLLANPLYSFGHAEGEYRENGESVLLSYEGPAYDLADNEVLTLREGNVRSGMSGAPVLNRKTGKVCGVLFASRDVRIALGGRAIPTKAAFSTFTQLKAAHDSFHAANKRWVKLWHEKEGAILLLDFPRGPVVENNRVGTLLIKAVANLYPTPLKAQAIVREANRLRIQADADGGVIDAAVVPPPTAAPMEYWFGVFSEACMQGPRMLAALLLVMDDWQFNEPLQRERREILDSLRQI